MPTWDAWLPYVLEVLKDGEETTRKTIEKRIIKHFSLPEEMVDVTYDNPNNSQGKLYNRIGFSMSLLTHAGALNRPRRAVYQITDKGLELLEKYGDKLTETDLKEQEEYIKYQEELALRNQQKDVQIDNEREDTGERDAEDIRKLVVNHNNQVAIELRDKLITVDPYFFEKIVVDLLEAMGYSGENGEAQITKRSHDGGIDGLINHDPLGTNTVYIQAKRYAKDNKIGAKEIQSFYGALAGIRADRGVFITTSDFTSGAKDYAKSQGIVLINGILLSDLMVRFGVGVEEEAKHILYRLDNDYFDYGEN